MPNRRSLKLWRTPLAVGCLVALIALLVGMSFLLDKKPPSLSQLIQDFGPPVAVAISATSVRVPRLEGELTRRRKLELMGAASFDTSAPGSVLVLTRDGVALGYLRAVLQDGVPLWKYKGGVGAYPFEMNFVLATVGPGGEVTRVQRMQLPYLEVTTLR